MGQTVGLPYDAVGFRVGAGCLAHEGLMFVNRVDNFPGSGAEFFALLRFCPLHLALGVEFGLGVGVLAGSGPRGVQERVDEP